MTVYELIKELSEKLISGEIKGDRDVTVSYDGSFGETDIIYVSNKGGCCLLVGE